jgi:hypothetical protein
VRARSTRRQSASMRDRDVSASNAQQLLALGDQGLGHFWPSSAIRDGQLPTYRDRRAFCSIDLSVAL